MNIILTLSLTTIKAILKNFPFKIFKIDHLLTHGGSLRLWISKGNVYIQDSVIKELDEEHVQKIFSKEKIRLFEKNANDKKIEFLQFLNKCKKDNKSVFAYGAAAKGISFLNFCGNQSKNILAIFDKNKMKQNCYIPGLNIKILDPIEIKRLKPDFIIILPWNLKEEIKKELAYIKQWEENSFSFNT